MQIVFLKRGKPKEFNYKPRYYDEEKEKMEKRRKQLEQSNKESSTDDEHLRLEMDRKWRKIDRSNHNKARGINIFIFLVIAAILIYFIFFV